MSSELSGAGKARKAAMLRELQGAMRRRQAVRTAGRVAAVLLVVAAPAAVWVSMAPRVNRMPPVARAPETGSMTVVVQTDVGILERLMAPTPERLVREISDRELASLLTGTGNSQGFVRTGGKVVLASDMEVEEPEKPKNASDSTS